MLGYFGKNQTVVTPAPGPAPASAPSSITKQEMTASNKPAVSPQPAESVESGPILPQAEESESGPIIQKQSQSSEIEMQLSQLRQSIEAKRLSKEREVAAVHEMQRKQAAYGRDTTQIKPKSAGYSTEAEKIMGGGTGYYAKPKPLAGLGSYLGYLGATSAEVSVVTGEVTRLTNVVKQLTKDVGAGMVPRSELEKAIQQLQTKSQEAKTLTAQLSGWAGNGLGESTSTAWAFGKLGLAVAAGYGIYHFLLKPRLSPRFSKKRRKR